MRRHLLAEAPLRALLLHLTMELTVMPTKAGPSSMQLSLHKEALRLRIVVPTMTTTPGRCVITHRPSPNEQHPQSAVCRSAIRTRRNTHIWAAARARDRLASAKSPKSPQGQVGPRPSSAIQSPDGLAGLADRMPADRCARDGTTRVRS